jgi:hypothetical protein
MIDDTHICASRNVERSTTGTVVEDRCTRRYLARIALHGKSRSAHSTDCSLLARAGAAALTAARCPRPRGPLDTHRHHQTGPHHAGFIPQRHDRWGTRYTPHNCMHVTHGMQRAREHHANGRPTLCCARWFVARRLPPTPSRPRPPPSWRPRRQSPWPRTSRSSCRRPRSRGSPRPPAARRTRRPPGRRPRARR